MSFSISELSINKPVFAWMLMSALIIFGGISFSRMGISQLPDVDFPVVGINLSLTGAAPEIMESQVLDPIEDVLMQISGIRNINSSAQQNAASISVEFELDRNIDDAIQEVQDKINQVKNLLPIDLLPATIRKTNPEDIPILWIALSSEDSVPLFETMMYAKINLYNQFASVPGVGDILLAGYVDPALCIEMKTATLNKFQLLPIDIINTITNEHVEIPAGRIENDQSEANVRIMGEATSPEEIGKIIVSNRTILGPNENILGAKKEIIRLRDIAKITEGTIDIRNKSGYNDK